MSIECDVAIIGGGLVGLSLARALDGSGLRVALVDRAGVPSEQDCDADSWDVRVYAISPGSEAFLTAAGAWPQDARIAPVLQMQVYGDAPHSRIVFGAFEAHVPHLASIVENRVLLGALWRALQGQPNLVVLTSAQCEAVRFEPQAAELTLVGGAHLRARLLVAADGADSWLRAQASIETTLQPYRQSAVVANFSCRVTHGGSAFQWFRSDGVVALLPLPGNRVSLVWSAQQALAEELMAGSADLLCAKVGEATGQRLGELELITAPAAFALRVARVARFVAPRLALIGDAAHLVHPLAGQGLNLGFQDARELARILRARGTCWDVGQLPLLRRYERARQEDVLAMTLLTDGLQRLFNNRMAPLAWLRNRGLNLVDRVAPLKQMLIRHALG